MSCVSMFVPWRQVQGFAQNGFSVTVCGWSDCGGCFRGSLRGTGTSAASGGKGRARPVDGLPVPGTGLHFFSSFLYNEARCLLKIQVSEIFFPLGLELNCFAHSLEKRLKSC